MNEIMITLNKIRADTPCQDGWKLALLGQGKTKADDEPFPLSMILDTNETGENHKIPNNSGLNDALWCLRCLPEYDGLWRKFAVFCARQVSHLSNDERVDFALDVAWKYSDGQAANEELDAARFAVCSAARVVDLPAAWAAARAADWSTARDAGIAAARVADWSADWSANWDADRAAQKSKLKQILDAGEWVD